MVLNMTIRVAIVRILNLYVGTILKMLTEKDCMKRMLPF